MSSHKQPLIHPFTFFLVHGIEMAYDQVCMGSPNYIESLNALYWLIGCLDEKGAEKLANCSEAIEKMMVDTSKVNRTTFRSVLTAVMQELHKEGYFLTAKLTPPTRATGLKQLSEKLELGH